MNKHELKRLIEYARTQNDLVEILDLYKEQIKIAYTISDVSYGANCYDFDPSEAWHVFARFPVTLGEELQ